LLDQAIREQEASLALDEIQNTTGVAIHLPELTAPEYNRKKAESRIPDDYDLDLMNPEEALNTPEAQPEPSRTKKKKGKDKGVRGQSAQQESSFKITLPATEIVNEEVYCYCRQVSFGKVSRCSTHGAQSNRAHICISDDCL
jgi:hypothetical protein